MSAAALHKHEVENVGNPEREITTVEVLGLDVNSDDESLPLIALIEDLQAALEKIPAEFRDTAVLNIRGYGDYVHVYADVKYKRPETDEEFADRKRWLKSLDDESHDRDLREYARLKQKFREAA